MSTFNPFPLALADLRSNRLLAAITVLLVAISLATGIAVISQERSLRQGSARAADDFDLLIGAPGSPTQLVMTSVYLRPQAIPLVDGDILARASAMKGVRYAAPIAFGDNWHGYPIIGTITDFVSRGGSLAPSEGRLFAKRGEAVVGANVKVPLGTSITPQHGLHRDDDDDGDSEDVGHHDAHHNMHYTVVGRLPARHNIWDTAILIPVEDVWQVHGLSTGHERTDSQKIGPPWAAALVPGVPAIAIKPESIAAAYGLRTQLRTPRSVALFPAEVLNDLYMTLGNVRDLMSLLALSTQVLVIVAVLMALLVGFLARKRQFAVLRAIGASRRYVFSVVWSEVAMLVASGAILGVGIGLAASSILARWLQTQTGFLMPVSLGQAEFWLVGGLVVAGMVVATLPAWLVFRRPIADGLKAS